MSNNENTSLAVEVCNLWTGYGSRAALEDISFSVRPQELVGVIGQ